MADSPLTPEDWPKQAMPPKVIDWLFDQMLSKWGKQFVDKWGVVDPDRLRKDWAKALYGLTEMEFRRGVAKMGGFDFPPSQPEFLKACRPEVNPTAAYYEALEGSRSREQGEAYTWSHPAIFWASVRVSGYELKQQSYSQIRQRWESALATELAKEKWDAIPAPMIAISAPNNSKASREAAEKMLAQLKAVGPPRTEQGDGKDWARRLLQREKNGEKISLIQRQFAREALGLGKEDA